jgi:predicted MFS family arabinose efflux permease
MPPTPFSRLVATHAASVFGDACVAASLAGSLFFSQPKGSARGDILLYLLLTMAPFAIVAPIMGPALDRIKGGRRLMVFLTIVARGVLCLAMMQFIVEPSPEGLLIYPLAFGILVGQKTYSIARSSLVPALVDDEDEFVRANSRLAIISLVASVAGGAPAFALQKAFDARYSLALAMLAFVVAAILAVKIPRTKFVQAAEDKQLEDEELHQPSILLAGSAMGVARGSVGYIVMFSAFAFKDDTIGLFLFAVAYGVGNLIGNVVAPTLRERVREEMILATALATTAAFVLLGALLGGTTGSAIAGLGVGIGASGGRLGFDSLLQRDGPDAVRGRAFARFETRFQVAWVIGALLGILPIAQRAGLLALAAVMVFAALSYIAALRAARGRVYRTTIRPKVVDEAVDRARDEFRGRFGRRPGWRPGRRRDPESGREHDRTS